MAGFYDDNDKEQDETIKKTIIGAVCMASIVFLVFLVCMYQGTKPKKTANFSTDNSESVADIDADFDEVELGKSNLKSKDLDFWDMFGHGKKSEDTEINSDSDEPEGTPAIFTEQGVKPDRIERKNKDDDGDEAKWVNGDPNDGTHIAITDSDGNKTWYEILDIAKSSYSSNKATTIDSGMVQYVDGNFKSAFGADVSSSIGVVDMSSVKNAGVTYVMIRSHIRDASTGIMSADPMFNINATNAKKEGLYIGMSVDSQAITDTEAIEEANYAVATAATVGPKYPIAINIPDSYDSSNRMSKLTNAQRTNIIKAFCDQVRSFGYKPMIHASKKDLITKINIEDLAAYDIWVTDIGESNSSSLPYFTDYPYTFTMWQYASGTNLCGINGGANLDASFVNYEQN